jgi:hypothetical protein
MKPEETIKAEKEEMVASVYEAESGLLITTTNKETSIEHNLTMFGKGNDFIKGISHAIKTNAELRDIFTEAFEQSGKAPSTLWFKAAIVASVACILALAYQNFIN